MDCPSCLDDLATPIVADASVVINLIASEFATTILGPLGSPLRVPGEVEAELDRGRSRGRKDAEELARLVGGGQAEIVALGVAGIDHFPALVAGSMQDTLDDGEAAAIAHALEHGATVLIDEKKATRLCAERFPHLQVGSTVDLVGCAAVQSALGANLADAIFNMLFVGKMRVSPQHLNWVVEQIGPQRAACCSALPAKYRHGGLRP